MKAFLCEPRKSKSLLTQNKQTNKQTNQVGALGSLVAQLVKNPPALWESGFNPWVGKIPWRRERLPTPVFWPGEFPGLYNPWGYKESDTDRVTFTSRARAFQKTPTQDSSNNE